MLRQWPLGTRAVLGIKIVSTVDFLNRKQYFTAARYSQQFVITFSAEWKKWFYSFTGFFKKNSHGRIDALIAI